MCFMNYLYTVRVYVEKGMRFGIATGRRMVRVIQLNINHPRHQSARRSVSII